MFITALIIFKAHFILSWPLLLQPCDKNEYIPLFIVKPRRHAPSRCLSNVYRKLIWSYDFNRLGYFQSTFDIIVTTIVITVW